MAPQLVARQAALPGPSAARPTEQAARSLAALGERLRARGCAGEVVTRALVELSVCLLAAATGLLPAGWTDALRADRPAWTLARVRGAFRALRAAAGLVAGDGAAAELDAGDGAVAELDAGDVALVGEAAGLDWLQVEPALPGMLLERGFEPARRRRLGAHYSDRDAIARVLEPVLLAPLRRELAAVQAAAGDEAGPRLAGFLARLRGLRVLDPSCGAGNFLVVALQAVMDLELEAIQWARGRGVEARPGVDARVVLGIELSPQAAELARLTIRIAQAQWARTRGVARSAEAAADIACRDALLERRPGAPPRRASWPDAAFIVGNPPFLGGKKLRAALGDAYVDDLFHAWAGRVPRGADLVAYFHEMAREMIAAGRCQRAGLLATQGIRGGANLEVLRRIKASGDIFMAWSDRPWIVDGAAVRVSIVGQDDGRETRRCLDGAPVAEIRADLSAGGPDGPDLRRARRLAENLGLAFMGDTKGGAFDVSQAQAEALLRADGNPNGRPNRDVVVPWVNGIDVLRRPRGRYIIDFGVAMSEAEARGYVLPFAQVQAQVRPARQLSRRPSYRARWWIHVEARPGLRAAIEPLRRFIATPTVARHRIFVWLARPTLPDHQLIVVAREDDWIFGVLHSRVHELWSLRLCSWLGLGNDPRYTPTTTFETFPFPWPPGQPETTLDPAQRRLREAIAAAAADLDAARRRWLAEDAARTLTALYNARPAWLAAAHAALDRAVLAAYGWAEDVADEALLAGLLARNLERAPRAGPRGA